jgi:hypothetical protein
MSNSSTSNSELPIFLRKFLGRAFAFLILLGIVFAFELPRQYYFSIPEKSSFSKITWIEKKLNNTKNLDNNVIFVGSSICMNGINDSLLNAWDTSGTSYLNLGQSHTCFAIIDVLIDNIVLERKLKPKKVMLCFKGDAMASLIHTMYPAAADEKKILNSTLQCNTFVIPSILKHASWNTNYVTRAFKFDDGDTTKIFTGEYGFEPQGYRDSAAVETIYKRLKAGSEANFAAIEQETKGAPQGLKTKLFLTKVDIMENVKFQRNSFANTAKTLDQHNIDYDIILYPNMISARMNKPHLMADYIRHTFKEIDYSKHRIIFMEDSTFKDARMFTDMNHLNPKGAEALTRLVYEELKKSENQ